MYLTSSNKSIWIQDQTIVGVFEKFIGLTYKLLPMRQNNNTNWESTLDTLLQSIAGLKRLISGQNEKTFVLLLCKLQGLHDQVIKQNFAIFRRTIFQSISLLNKLKGIYINEG